MTTNDWKITKTDLAPFMSKNYLKGSLGIKIWLNIMQLVYLTEICSRKHMNVSVILKKSRRFIHILDYGGGGGGGGIFWWRKMVALGELERYLLLFSPRCNSE